jgi:hypothetical protein
VAEVDHGRVQQAQAAVDGYWPASAAVRMWSGTEPLPIFCTASIDSFRPFAGGQSRASGPRTAITHYAKVNSDSSNADRLTRGFHPGAGSGRLWTSRMDVVRREDATSFGTTTCVGEKPQTGCQSGGPSVMRRQFDVARWTRGAWLVAGDPMLRCRLFLITGPCVPCIRRYIIYLTYSAW